MKIKNYLTLSILLFGSLLIFTSCDDNFFDVMKKENDIKNQTPWSSESFDIPPREGMVIAQSEDKILTYIYGGVDYGNVRSDLWVYNNLTKKALYLRNYVPRAFATGQIINKKLYIFGGYSGNPGSELLHNEILIYDIDSNTWDIKGNSLTTGNRPSARYKHISMKSGNFLIIQGGESSYSNDSNTITFADRATYILDTIPKDENNKMDWTKGLDGPQVTGHSSCSSSNGLFVFGGYGIDTFYGTSSLTARSVIVQHSNELWQYFFMKDNIKKSTWRLISETNDINLGRRGTSMSHNSDRLYITTGYNSTYLKSMLVFNITTKTWENKTNFKPEPRKNHVSWIYDNSLIIFGGSTNDKNLLYPKDYWLYSL